MSVTLSIEEITKTYKNLFLLEKHALDVTSERYEEHRYWADSLYGVVAYARVRTSLASILEEMLEHGNDKFTVLDHVTEDEDE